MASTMTASPPTSAEPEIVRALRAAGCVFAEDEAKLLLTESRSEAELTSRVERRIAGEPLEVILGWTKFGGLRIEIDPGVFVPRQRTEYLVRRAARVTSPGSIVVDLCCGSGALGAALAARVPGIRLVASDIEPAAIACARRNLVGLGEVLEGDLFEALPPELRGRIDVLMVNAPYVPTGEIAGMPPEARDYEPLITLDGGSDGLDVHRRVAADASVWLAPGGTLLIETSRPQAQIAASIIRDAGLTPRIVRSKKRAATVVLGAR
jgi:release factor glutamine methyltransferase